MHSDLSGLNFLLAQATFALSGETMDGLTSNPIPGVQIYGNGQLLTTSDDLGNYAVQLVNGSYTFQAVPPGEPGERLHVRVLPPGARGDSDRPEHRPLPTGQSGVRGSGGRVIRDVARGGLGGPYSGMSEEGLSVETVFTTDSLGSFAVAAVPGTFPINVSMLGYTGANLTLHTAGEPRNPSRCG